MTSLRLLVCEGNVPAVRANMRESAGGTAGEGYARTLREIDPAACVDIVCAADADAALPAPLDAYDGVAITGSALNVYDAEPPVLRQVEFARNVFAAGVPFFGSCWGLQVATVAAGGDVVLNPRGREVGFARKVILTDDGSGHPMHTGRERAFDAPAVHSDIVARLPDGAVVTASNAMSAVQAAEIRCGAGVFWGVQYHPEYRLADVAWVVARYGQRLVDEGFFRDVASLQGHVEDLLELERDPGRVDIAWRLGLGADVLEAERRLCEIANWLSRQVRPTASRRVRA